MLISLDTGSYRLKVLKVDLLGRECDCLANVETVLELTSQNTDETINLSNLGRIQGEISLT